MIRDADETIAWIQEKDAVLSSDDYGRDLASVQALQRKHEGVERDLAALEEKVCFSSFFFFVLSVKTRTIHCDHFYKCHLFYICNCAKNQVRNAISFTINSHNKLLLQFMNTKSLKFKCDWSMFRKNLDCI